MKKAGLWGCLVLAGAAGRDCPRRIRASGQRMAARIDGRLNLSRTTRTLIRREALALSALAPPEFIDGVSAAW